ncbi:MAG: DMT family transporter [Prolixibacteraceae bacterium]|jgi:drug/metabolite transporter (DMT)-like permease|nr:DMT family transporter [Prolixibacteraceae bacterium]
MQNKNSIKIYGAVILAMVCFALSFVWFKVANITYGPMTIVLFRLLISSVILFIFTKLSKRLILPDWKDFKYLLLLAFFEPFIYFMGESYGLQYISSTIGAVIIATIPLVAPFAAYLFYKEKITFRNIIGILISFFGVTIVIFEIGMGITASPLGILLQFCAVLAAVGYTVVLHKISNKINNLSIILFQNIIGSIFFLPLWLIFEKNRFLTTSFDQEAMLAILYLAIFASTFAFIFFTYSVRHLGITKANMFTNTIPVFTAIFAWIILGDQLTLQKFIGIVVVIAGLFFAQMRFKKRYDGPDPIPRT